MKSGLADSRGFAGRTVLNKVHVVSGRMIKKVVISIRIIVQLEKNAGPHKWHGTSIECSSFAWDSCTFLRFNVEQVGYDLEDFLVFFGFNFRWL